MLPPGSLIAPTPARIRRDHRLWQNLVFAMPGWTPDDIAGGMAGTLNGAINTTVGPFGLAIEQGGNGAYISYSPVDESIWNPTVGSNPLMTGPITVLAVHTPTTTTRACLLNFSDGNSGACPFAFVWSFGTSQKYSFWNDNEGVNGAFDPAVAALYEPHVVIGRRDGYAGNHSSMDLWVDGVIVDAQTNVNQQGQGDNGSKILAINRYGGFDGYYGDGGIHSVFAWSGALTDADCVELSADPWYFMRPRRRAYAFAAPLPEAVADYAATWDDFAAVYAASAEAVADSAITWEAFAGVAEASAEAVADYAATWEAFAGLAEASAEAVGDYAATWEAFAGVAEASAEAVADSAITWEDWAAACAGSATALADYAAAWDDFVAICAAAGWVAPGGGPRTALAGNVVAATSLEGNVIAATNLAGET